MRQIEGRRQEQTRQRYRERERENGRTMINN